GRQIARNLLTPVARGTQPFSSKTVTRTACRSRSLGNGERKILGPLILVAMFVQRRRARGRHALLRGLLEGIGETNQRRLSASLARKSDAVGPRLRIEPIRKRRRRCIRHKPERHRNAR